MTGRPNLALNSALHGLRVVVNVGCVLALTPLLIATLGVTGFGVWALAMTALSLVLFLELGSVTLLTKISAEERESPRGREEALSRLLRRRLLVRGLIAAGALGLAAHWLGRALGGDRAAELTGSLRLVACFAPALLCLSLAPARLQGHARHLAFNLTAILGRLTQLALAWAALLAFPTPEAATLASLAGMLLTSSLQTVLARQPEAIAERLDLEALRDQARSFGAINLAVLLSTQAGVVLAGLLLGPGAAGLYRVADRIVHHLVVFLKQLGAVLAPEVAACTASGRSEELRRIFVLGCRWVLLLGLPVLALLVTWGDWLLVAWLGPVGVEVAPLAAALWAAALLSLIQAQAVILLVFGKRHRRVAVAFLLTALADVAASAVLATRFGIWGLVLGTLCTVSVLDLLWFVPAGCRQAGLRVRELFWEAFGVTGGFHGVVLAGLIFTRWLFPAADVLGGSLALFGVALLAVVSGYRLALETSEREALRRGVGQVRRLLSGLVNPNRRLSSRVSQGLGRADWLAEGAEVSQ